MQVLELSAVAPAKIAELAEQRLRKSPYFFLKNLRCDFNDGVLTLRGRVPQAQLKPIAEKIVSRVEGVEKIVNRVEIFDPVAGVMVVPAVHNVG